MQVVPGISEEESYKYQVKLQKRLEEAVDSGNERALLRLIVCKLYEKELAFIPKVVGI